MGLILAHLPVFCGNNVHGKCVHYCCCYYFFLHFVCGKVTVWASSSHNAFLFCSFLFLLSPDINTNATLKTEMKKTTKHQSMNDGSTNAATSFGCRASQSNSSPSTTTGPRFASTKERSAEVVSKDKSVQVSAANKRKLADVSLCTTQHYVFDNKKQKPPQTPGFASSNNGKFQSRLVFVLLVYSPLIGVALPSTHQSTMMERKNIILEGM